VSDSRVVLLGLNNPLSASPLMALWPDPPRCTGWNLWRMIDCSKEDFVRGFDRRNLVDATVYNRPSQEHTRQLWRSLDGRRVIVLGATVLSELVVAGAVGHRPPWILPQRGEGPLEWRMVPHPSGRCREYNDPAMRLRVSMLLQDYFHNWSGRGKPERLHRDKKRRIKDGREAEVLVLD
jgi:hypothetical protein